MVYRSAVRVGDWALVAPMLEEEAWDDAGRRALVMREGWVTDVLLDEAYPPDGGALRNGIRGWGGGPLGWWALGCGVVGGWGPSHTSTTPSCAPPPLAQACWSF